MLLNSKINMLPGIKEILRHENFIEIKKEYEENEQNLKMVCLKS